MAAKLINGHLEKYQKNEWKNTKNEWKNLIKVSIEFSL
jgi:hypothetical protein